MSVDTYIYAMVGIHCKDVCTTKKEKVRGCNHQQMPTKFCAVCGKVMWVDSKTETWLSDQLEHLSEYSDDDEERADVSISMIYSPMCGPIDFVVGQVLENVSADVDGHATPFNVLSDAEYDIAKHETKAVLEPLGLWDPTKFGYLLYAICM